MQRARQPPLNFSYPSSAVLPVERGGAGKAEEVVVVQYRTRVGKYETFLQLETGWRWIVCYCVRERMWATVSKGEARVVLREG